MSQEAERKRAASTTATPAVDVVMEDAVVHTTEETEESAALKNSESAAMLFGHVATFQNDLAPSSPMLKPTLVIEMPPPPFKLGNVKMEREDPDLSWADLKSPEHIELDELEDLLGGY